MSGSGSQLPPKRPPAKTAVRPVQVPVVADKVQDGFNREVATLGRTLAECPILNGVLLEGVEFESLDKTVAHGLGRIPRGYLVVSGYGHVWQYQAATTTQLYLRSDALVTVDLWVF